MIDRRFETMTPGELESAVAEKPLAWLPIGTLEWHGRHLPVGLDALKAHSLCLRFAARAGGVVLPPDYFSILGMNFPWTFKYSPDILARSVFTTLRKLDRSGFRAMIVITGHYPQEQVLLLMAVAEMFSFIHRGSSAVAVPEFAMAGASGYNGDHAAKWETSIMMELFPELVDSSELEVISGKRGFSLFRHGIQGRNPAEHASRETGATVIAEMTENFAALSEDMLRSPGPALPRRVHSKTISSHIKRLLRALPEIF